MRALKPLQLENTLSQARDAAMRKSGIDPKLVAIKPGTRRMRDRKAAHARGHCKHKAKLFD